MEKEKLLSFLKRKQLFFFFIVICLFVIRTLYIVTGGIRYITSSLTIDDAYYYFETAWNTKERGFVTFDTINKTNGVQFFWFWLLYLLSYLAATKDIFLIEIMIFSLIINITCYFIIWKIGKLFENEICGFLIAGFWIFPSFVSKTFLIGMENTIHGLIIWSIVFYCIKILKKQYISDKEFIIISLLLILNVWTRYDSIFLSGIIYLLMLLLSYFNRKKNRKSSSNKIIKISFLIIGTGAFIQFFGFFLMGDSILPVNALIKIYNSPKLSFISIIKNICYIIVPLNINSLYPYTSFLSSYVLSLTPYILTLFFLLFNIWTLYILFSKKLNQIKYQSLLIVILILSFTILLYSFVMSRLFYQYYRWYLSASYILWTLIFTFIIMENIEKIRKIINLFLKEICKFNTIIKKQNFLNFIAIGLILLSTTQIINRNGFPTKENNNITSSFYFLRYEVGIWLRENVDEEAVIGSWNAGQIGYFSNRKVINLDGLINHISYYETIIRNENRYSSTEFEDYLNKMNITYIVDYNFNGFSPENSNYTKIKEFTFNYLRSIQVWVKLND